MKYIKNNSGFTLVELLAVIVILALIMGIAAFSIQGVIGDAEISSMKSSAAVYVDGLRDSIMMNGDIADGYFYISDGMLEKKVSSPWGNYVYYTGTDTAIKSNIASKGYSAAGATLTCGGTGATGSFVQVTKSGNNYSYAICLYDDQGNYIFASEEVLNDRKSDSNDYYRSGVTAALTLENGKIKDSAA